MEILLYQIVCPLIKPKIHRYKKITEKKTQISESDCRVEIQKEIKIYSGIK